MKYNNGDMDDLFRRASERYPLRTDSADWDRLASALDGGPAAPSDEKEKRRRRGVFWWFLLIPLAGIGYWTWQVGMHHSLDKSVTRTTAKGAGAGVEGNAVSGENAVTDSGGGNRVEGGEKVRKMRTSEGNGTYSGSSRNAVGVDRQDVVDSGGSNKGISGGGKVRILRTRAGGRAKVGRPDSPVSAGGLAVDGGAQVAGTTAGAEARPGGAAVSPRTGGRRPGNGRSTAVVDRNNNLMEVSENAVVTGSPKDATLALLDLRRAPIGERHPILVDVVASKATQNRKATQDRKPSVTQHSHGYIGVFVAPDFSTVRFQTMKGVGTTFGVLLGYSFNERWAVETGLSLDMKRYYTAGEYFKKAMPSGYTLLNVDGTCNMLEIPVNVRYNFSKGSKMKWFATAGLSTYLMSKENYNYEYSNYWGSTADSDWSIHKPSQYWFSIINLSAGFEQRVGKIGNLRLEPYARIPLSRIGTGKLPIVSAGLNIGLVRTLW
jgi:Outer membrane protein beta-barrel domain